MTRQEFHNEVKCNPDYLGWHNVHELADKLFDEVGKDTTCDGCKYQPKEGEYYPIECGTCCRWYGDGYEKSFTV